MNDEPKTRMKQNSVLYGIDEHFRMYQISIEYKQVT